MAYKTAAIAQLAQDWTPNVKEEGKKGPKDWLQRSQDMRKFALELAEVAGKGDPQQLRAVARKLDATCDGCHKIYK